MQEKLSTCVENLALGGVPMYKKDRIRQLSFSLLNDYTLSHIRLLQYFSVDHFRLVNKGSGTVTIIGGTEQLIKGILETLPEFKDDTAFVKHIAKQLVSDSLIDDIDFDKPVSKERARGKRITQYGKEFLNFIKEDIEG